MNCEEILTLLDAYFDNELDLAKTVAIEEQLRTCASCRSQYELRVALRSRLDDPDLRYAAPNGLADQIRKKLALSNRPTRKILSFPITAWIPAAVAAAAVFGAFVYANIGRLLPGETPSLVAEVASDHIRSLIGTHLVDVESSDQHTVKPWFAGKVDFSPPVRDFADQGFKLVGGRLDYVRGKNVAVLVYRFKNQYVSLFICPERTPGQPRSKNHSIIRATILSIGTRTVSIVGPYPMLRTEHFTSSSKFGRKNTLEDRACWKWLSCGLFG